MAWPTAYTAAITLREDFMVPVLKRPIRQVLPGIQTKLRRFWWHSTTHSPWSTCKWVWCRLFPRITGVPVLSDGRVTPLVYIGPQHSRLGKWWLRRAGIRHIVSLCSEFNDADHGLTLESYCYLPTEDNEAPSLEHLRQGVAFIQRAVAQGEKVYIHCKHGKGRSPALAAAYLIRDGLTFAQAQDLVRQARPSVGLTSVQRAQLETFGQEGSSAREP